MSTPENPCGTVHTRPWGKGNAPQPSVPLGRYLPSTNRGVAREETTRGLAVTAPVTRKDSLGVGDLSFPIC